MARDNLTKETLQFKFATLLKSKEDMELKYKKEIDELNKRNNALDKELSAYKKREQLNAVEEDVIKYALEEKAKNKNLAVITRSVNQNFYTSYTSQDMENMIGNISDLSIELQEVYYKLVEKYAEIRKMDDKIEKDNITQNYNYLYDRTSILLENIDVDTESGRKEQRETYKIMIEILDKKAKVNKLVGEEVVKENELLSKIAKGLTNSLNGKTPQDDFEEMEMPSYVVQ